MDTPRSVFTQPQKMMRFAIVAGLLLAAHLIFQSRLMADNLPLSITVYKTPTCSCCQAWVDYLEDSNLGFEISVKNFNSLDRIKADLGMTDRRLHSCHTAVIGDYLIEGHVPVMDIQRLLSEKPDVLGLTAPGMPMLSPGMNSLEPKDYDVLSFDRDGNVELFSRY